MQTIDGRRGEGGGQILRSTLALAALAGTPVTIDHIRAKRSKPGLMRQHLTAVRAAAAVCDASVEGDSLRSDRVVFEPGPIRGGDYHFSIGSAGSVMLVLQTILPILLAADGASTLRLEGGTHNPNAPTFDFLERAFAPQLERMGASLDMELVRPGFYPAGGGEVRVRLEPSGLQPLELLERGALEEAYAVAMRAHLPEHINIRELEEIEEALGGETEARGVELALESVDLESSHGPGNVVHIELFSEHVTEVFTAFGRKGRPAEKVADEAARAALRYLRGGDVPVGEHLADQLLMPLALAGGGRFRTLEPTRHSRTHAEILEDFLDVDVSFERRGDDDWRVEVRGA